MTDFNSDVAGEPAGISIQVMQGHCEDMLHRFAALHDEICAFLPEDKKHYLRRRTLPDIRAHFAAGHAGIVAMSGRTMVAQLLLAKADGGGLRHLENYPFGPKIAPHDTMTMQAVGVKPGWRRGELGRQLLEAACDHACLEGRGILLGKTSNPSGIRTFESAGFVPVSALKNHGADAYASVFMAKALPVLQVVEPKAFQQPGWRNQRLAVLGQA